MTKEIVVDTVGAYVGTGATVALWAAQVNPVLVAVSAIITLAFTLRKWWILEERRRNDG